MSESQAEGIFKTDIFFYTFVNNFDHKHRSEDLLSDFRIQFAWYSNIDLLLDQRHNSDRSISPTVGFPEGSVHPTIFS